MSGVRDEELAGRQGSHAHSRRAGAGGHTVGDALEGAVTAIAAAGCATPRLDAEVLLAEVLGLGCWSTGICVSRARRCGRSRARCAGAP
jgi:hypothetical protein